MLRDHFEIFISSCNNAVATQKSYIMITLLFGRLHFDQFSVLTRLFEEEQAARQAPVFHIKRLAPRSAGSLGDWVGHFR